MNTSIASAGPDGALAIVGDNTCLTWYRRLMWVGIAANVVTAGASIMHPARVLALLGLEPAVPLVWPRFAGFLLILLSGFYVLAALDPVRHSFAAIFAVVCRFGGVLFFALIGGGYVIFAAYDLLFGLPQAVLLASGRRRHLR
jgi:hypothetical protein